jgi:4-amino-4-deoxy-L-arabinose transferase-like glycosyltransferase
VNERTHESRRGPFLRLALSLSHLPLTGVGSVLLVIALSIAVKALYVALLVGFGAPPETEAGDGPTYHHLASNISLGLGFSLDGMHPTAIKPPAYPYFLAAIYAVGAQFAAVRLIQIALLTAVAVIVMVLGADLTGRSVALISGLLVACDPLLGYLSGSLLSESLAIFLLALTVWQLSKLVVCFTARRAILAGALCALAILTRANFMFVVPWIALWLLAIGGRRRGTVVAAAFVLAVALFTAPWAIRNTLSLGSFIPVSTVGGEAFWGANNPVAEGDWVETELQGALPASPQLPEVELQAYYYAQGENWIREHPGDFARLLPWKIIRLFDYDPHSVRSDKEPLLRAVGLVPYGIMLPFFFVGAVAGRRDPRVQLVLCLVLGMVTSALVFYGDPRMRSPIQPYLYVLAAVGLRESWLRIRSYVGQVQSHLARGAE